MRPLRAGDFALRVHDPHGLAGGEDAARARAAYGDAGLRAPRGDSARPLLLALVLMLLLFGTDTDGARRRQRARAGGDGEGLTGGALPTGAERRREGVKDRLILDLAVEADRLGRENAALRGALGEVAEGGAGERAVSVAAAGLRDADAVRSGANAGLAADAVAAATTAAAEGGGGTNATVAAASTTLRIGLPGVDAEGRSSDGSGESGGASGDSVARERAAAAAQAALVQKQVMARLRGSRGDGGGGSVGDGGASGGGDEGGSATGAGGERPAANEGDGGQAHTRADAAGAEGASGAESAASASAAEEFVQTVAQVL